MRAFRRGIMGRGYTRRDGEAALHLRAGKAPALRSAPGSLAVSGRCRRLCFPGPDRQRLEQFKSSLPGDVRSMQSQNFGNRLSSTPNPATIMYGS